MPRPLARQDRNGTSKGPGAGTDALPEIFDRLVTEKRRLHASRPQLADWCAELANIGVPDSLDHSDLHEGQLFAPEPGRFTFFDWGDALVGPPFCSLLVPARAARERYGSDVLPRLRDAYLEPWTGTGDRTPADLRRAADPACRLGAIGRACSWVRLFAASASGATGATVDTGADESAAYRLRRLMAPVRR